VKYFGLLFALACVLAFYVWQQTQSMRMGYAVDNCRKDCEKWEQENKTLRLKINRLLSMERLDSIAKEKKLVTPDEKKIIYLKEQ
jgi:cell division protein FtsL